MAIFEAPGPPLYFPSRCRAHRAARLHDFLAGLHLGHCRASTIPVSGDHPAPPFLGLSSPRVLAHLPDLSFNFFPQPNVEHELDKISSPPRRTPAALHRRSRKWRSTPTSPSSSPSRTPLVACRGQPGPPAAKSWWLDACVGLKGQRDSPKNWPCPAMKARSLLR